MRVEAAWAQTWIAGGQRQDRFVYRFHGAGPQITLSLPEEFGQQPLEVMVDGRIVPSQTSTPDLLVVALPQDRHPAIMNERHTGSGNACVAYLNADIFSHVQCS